MQFIFTFHLSDIILVHGGMCDIGTQYLKLLNIQAP